MAAACGQQRWTCRYDVKGVPCGKSFESDSELLSHYKIHLGQLTQTNGTTTTNSTTTLTTNNGGGKMLKTPKTSPSSSTSSPKQYPQTANSPANLFAWQNSQQQQTMRYHPYMKMPPPPPINAQQQAVMQQQFQQQQLFYEMAAAAMASGMPIMGMQNPQAAVAALHSQMAQQQAAEKQV